MTEENTRKVKPSAVKEPEPQVDDIEQEIDEEKLRRSCKDIQENTEKCLVLRASSSYFETLDKNAD